MIDQLLISNNKLSYNMDIRQATASDTRYNFHTHTQFCDGHDTMEAIACAAADAGITRLGFSPHSPISIPSPCNMAERDVDAFLAECNRLGGVLGGQCKLYAGMEVDFLGPDDCAASSRYASYGLDYKIGSVHFVRTRRGEFVDIDGRPETFLRKLRDCFGNDIRYVVESYYGASREMLALGGFDILGHFDKIGLNASAYRPEIEQEDWYQALLDSYVREIIQSGITVEINTKARSTYGRFFPHERLWKTLVDGGTRIIVNSDAHYASLIEAGRQEAFDLLGQIVGHTPK